ncbi:MAG: Ig-like domain-containing protein, partial [Mycobacterium sp.]|nr:Ig-like domain-containing protein [Mycobacterium sp.]
MATGLPIGRLGPLAVALGIGAAMAISGAAAAGADSADSPSVRSEARSDTGPSTRSETGKRQRPDRAPSWARTTPPPSAARQPAVAPARQRAAAATGGGLGALLNNRTPTVSAGGGEQSAGGVVRGEINAADDDSGPLSYSVTRQPEHGSVAVETDGTYTYTADPALAATGTSDTFVVSVSDAGSGFHVHGLLGLLNLLTFGLIGSSGHVATVTVGVTVAPFGGANRPPSGTVSAGSPDPVSGVVSGAVIGSDPDGDPLTYSGSATTGKGTVL